MVNVPAKKLFDECMIWSRTAWSDVVTLDPILLNESKSQLEVYPAGSPVRVHRNSLHPLIDGLAIHLLGLGYPFIFVSDAVFRCMSAENIAALVRWLVVRLFGEIILLSKEELLTHDQDEKIPRAALE